LDGPQRESPGAQEFCEYNRSPVDLSSILELQMTQRPSEFVVAQGIAEDGIPAGNYYDKYGSRNPVVRYLMTGFQNSLEELVSVAAPRSIHEVGCGEGYWTLKWAAQGIQTQGTDFSNQVIAIAQANGQRQTTNARFRAASIYDLKAPRDAAELVVCCEVLEHLEEPQKALDVLVSLATPWLIVSVPREPIWRMLNLARGQYLSDLGNTPGHIQHWSKGSLVQMLKTKFEIVAVRSPLPWTMVLCRRHTSSTPPAN
jgi:SAM-dependent methyltransferase